MYSSQHANMAAASQKPETFMLSTEAQQALPHDAQVALQQVDNLKYFLISAPVDWQPDQYIRRFLLPTGEYVSCVLWNNLFHISGTDIVRCLSFRFQAFGRPVKNSKKFEEGIFSDLRNLKAGSDASLEEPKSPFLDFLYKNNCIRTQKKQKVFFWYSVPHDRLFLDALERDLKREKMGQEATTVAVSEPALSFQYDSSQSLFESLTKAQQANSSSFPAQQLAFQSQSTSPILRAADSMPPPQMMQPMPSQMMQPMGQNMGQQMSQTMSQSMAPLSDGLEAMVSYGAMTMGPAMTCPQPMVKREPDYGRVQYTQNGVPITQVHQRHTSMPAYGLECSPAPSFVSSHFEDYSQRGLSFEPLTPPHQQMGVIGEPAYIANEETGLYTAIPDHLNAGALNGMMQLPPSNLAAPSYPRSYASSSISQDHARGYSPMAAYTVIEGSPTYKQRRRRSSIPPSVLSATTAIAAGTPGLYKPSDLRRSVSASVGAVAEGDESADNSPPGLTYSNPAINMARQQHHEMLELSRHGTPLSTVEGSPALNPMNISMGQSYGPLNDDELVPMSERQMSQGHPGVIRRARSATVSELGPYPQKSHSCPIPSCGRVFKRLEHLKRHVRTHTQERPYVCSYCQKAFSRSDNLAQHKRTHDRGDGSEGTSNLSGEEEEEYSSPTSEGGYVHASGAPSNGNSSTPQSTMYNNLQTLSMPMTISEPQPINTGEMMRNELDF
ncbi:hypothetical protein NEUTE1DRAFT_63506 [Neurospora tetrasperma FGSC 2508]|uniref:Transcription factor MST12 n=1 Tax=Neurospora tetrasperma (strain FGSC 2508 / ATCC MYA-4615 / P0657) TaxID=510951 RepID=F8MN76_NEUT8|nr:uncharacterized protein NEUTE1DRAFT_63506 [Neurospora tetrasperma FGSC 2508]EGO58046.1 hypothetical protein NEUTE1DRAFT_63506 [Neurospora tetrasperma FGSC 2508]EGZ71645.1 Ste12-like transcription factor [Neurospora tetrasperma FGSC 2509]